MGQTFVFKGPDKSRVILARDYFINSLRDSRINRYRLSFVFKTRGGEWSAGVDVCGKTQGIAALLYQTALDVLSGKVTPE